MDVMEAASAELQSLIIGDSNFGGHAMLRGLIPVRVQVCWNWVPGM